jgi:methionine sulfoxide reductase catalytic subunit
MTKGGLAVGEPVYRSRDEFRRLALLHRYNAVAVFGLLGSGLLLYAEPLRGLLAPVRVPLKYLHVGLGLWLFLWAAARAPAWGGFLLRRGLHAGRRLNTALTAAWLGAWGVTGALMYLRGLVPYGVSNAATLWHDWLTWLSLPWLILHVAFRLLKVRRPGGRLEVSGWLAAPATRRALLWGGAAAAGAWLLGPLLRASGPDPDLTDDRGLSRVDPTTLAGGGMKGRFRLYFVNDTVPVFDPSTWRLAAGSKTYTWEQFQALPRTTLVRNFHCVTGWSVFNITWEGVRLRDLLASAGVTQSAALTFVSGDGEYTDSLTWEQAMADDVLLADTIDGVPLPRAQGGPVRLVVPEMYGYKSVKWVQRLFPHDDPGYRGYWEERGYSVDAYLERNEPIGGGGRT